MKLNDLIAQRPVNVGVPISGEGPFGTSANASQNFTRILTIVIGVLTLVAGIWFIFLLLTGGIEWMGSGGDKGKLASARQKMFSGAIGLTIVVSALFIAQIFGGLIGLPNILDPAGEIGRLMP